MLITVSSEYSFVIIDIILIIPKLYAYSGKQRDFDGKNKQVAHLKGNSGTTHQSCTRCDVCKLISCFFLA